MGKKTLIWILHGLRGNENTMADLKKMAEACYPDAKAVARTYPHSSAFATIKAAKIVRQILDEITHEYEAEPFERLILIGHSMGAVLARRVALEAQNLDSRWTTETPQNGFHLKVENELAGLPQYEWAHTIDTLIMLASVGRGWNNDNAKTGLQKLYWTLGGLLGHMLPGPLKPTIFEFRKGSPFVVQTRLRWLELNQDPKRRNRIRLFQFLGTVDEVVPPNDSIDFSMDSSGKHFTQIEVPNTGHRSVVWLEKNNKASAIENTTRDLRKKILRGVLENKVDEFAPYVVSRDQLVDELPPEPDDLVKNLVFVVHGIRDRGYWTKKVAGRIKNKAKAGELEFASRTPSYGFFPILPFLLPWYRRQKVEWLMDNYVEAVATYPKADIHYMGHSNGTYLCAKALLDYPSVTFKHIMFAGSVVRPDYPWGDLVSAGKVSKIFNALATSDLVVAVFPHGLRQFKNFFDLGGAGHVGFEDKSIPDALFQLDTGSRQAFVKGGHSAAREEHLWDDIADFIVDGSRPDAAVDEPIFAAKQPWLSRILGKFAPVIVYLLAFIILGLGVLLTATLSLDLGLGSLFGFSYPTEGSNGGLWSTWMKQGISTHILSALLYVALLRFMALRF